VPADINEFAELLVPPGQQEELVRYHAIWLLTLICKQKKKKKKYSFWCVLISKINSPAHRQLLEQHGSISVPCRPIGVIVWREGYVYVVID
jgi:hypothetical protein